MKAMEHLRPGSADAAVSAMAENPDARYLGGGTDLVGHLKLGVVSPDLLVDISRLPMDTVEQYDGPDGSGPAAKAARPVTRTDDSNR
jgi:xanthine dehydrogenase YagS FAD-binding subunit